MGNKLECLLALLYICTFCCCVVSAVYFILIAAAVVW